MSELSAPRGAPDVLPPRSGLYESVIRAAEDMFKRYGYQRIDTPAFEQTEVFERSLDSASDIVTKEMYTFQDKGGRSLTLRPEGTAPVVRAALEHHLERRALPVKLYYTAAMFRYERPQAGRTRQFTQVGVEALGSRGPEVDAEVIELGAAVYRAAGLTGIGLLLNSIGHPGCRSRYLPALVAFLEARRSELCPDCQRKITTNPLRTFDCKVGSDREVMAEAPLITGFLCEDCAVHFESVRGLLGEAGVDFRLEPRLVRGLDYYTRTTFAYVAEGLGAQNEVGGGGRYDGLAEQLGGESLPGIGFALGVDRMVLALEAQGVGPQGMLDVFIAALGEQARRRAFQVTTELRADGLAADLDYADRGLKGQLKAADRLGARSVVMIGERELAEDRFTVRDMVTGEEAAVEAGKLSSHLRGLA